MNDHAIIDVAHHLFDDVAAEVKRIRRGLYRAGLIKRPQSRYRQTRRGRVPALHPLTRLAQRSIRSRGGRR